MRYFNTLIAGLLIVGLLLVCSNVANADPENKPVRDAIQQYIDGSSYTQRDKLIGAFHPDATLYLTAKQGSIRYSPTQYADFFAHQDAGKFNGRVGEILSIEVINDIATAKASISIPERELVYIDLFLLKKTDDAWQIISKTATRLSQD